MRNKLNYSQNYLLQDFERHKARNSKYSLRAYAKKLSLNPAALSMVLSGERNIPKKHIMNIVKSLELSPSERKDFLASIIKKPISLKELKELSNISVKELDSQFHNKVIIQWEHYAILALLDIKNNPGTKSWIGKRLGLKKEQLELALKRLEDSHLIEIKKNKVSKKVKSVTTTIDIPSKVIVDAHIELLEVAVDKIKEIDVEMRDYSASAIAIDPDKIPEAKILIREFRKKLSQFLQDGDQREVYNIGIQLYPFTKIEQKLQSKKGSLR